MPHEAESPICGPSKQRKFPIKHSLLLIKSLGKQLGLLSLMAFHPICPDMHLNIHMHKSLDRPPNFSNAPVTHPA